MALLLIFSVINSFQWLWMGSLHKNTQLMLEFLKVPFLVLHFSYYTLMTFPDDIICNITIYADDATLYFKCDHASVLWQQLELTSELNLVWDTGAESGLLISVLKNLNWFRLTGQITLVLLKWTWTSLFLMQNYLLRCWGWLSFLHWIGALEFIDWSLGSFYEVFFSWDGSVSQ